MYGITFYIESNRTWTLDIIFKTSNEAEQYLFDQDYIINNRWFERKSNGWYGDTRAIINKFKIKGEE